MWGTNRWEYHSRWEATWPVRSEIRPNPNSINPQTIDQEVDLQHTWCLPPLGWAWCNRARLVDNNHAFPTPIWVWVTKTNPESPSIQILKPHLGMGQCCAVKVQLLREKGSNVDMEDEEPWFRVFQNLYCCCCEVAERPVNVNGDWEWWGKKNWDFRNFLPLMSFFLYFIYYYFS